MPSVAPNVTRLSIQLFWWNAAIMPSEHADAEGEGDRDRRR